MMLNKREKEKDLNMAKKQNNKETRKKERIIKKLGPNAEEMKINSFKSEKKNNTKKKQNQLRKKNKQK